MDRLPTSSTIFMPGQFLARHLAIALAVALAVIPTVYTLATTLWPKADQEHGPIILALVCWLFWRKRSELALLPSQRASFGWVLLGCFVLAYALGRSQGIYFMEVGAFIPLIGGLVLLEKGWAGLRCISFALFFMIYLLPLPGQLVDAITSGLKEYVSNVAEWLLYRAGYPIARNGVMLSIGQYQLLVADACSGLNSMFSLSALGFLYVYLTKPTWWWQRVVIILALLPIAFVANVARVIGLVLLTYYYGDEAGQGFMHTLAGLSVFAVALVLVGVLGETLNRLGRKPVGAGK